MKMDYRVCAENNDVITTLVPPVVPAHIYILVVLLPQLGRFPTFQSSFKA